MPCVRSVAADYRAIGDPLIDCLQELVLGKGSLQPERAEVSFLVEAAQVIGHHLEEFPDLITFLC